MASITFEYKTTGSAGFEFAMVGDSTTLETAYEDGRLVNETTGLVRNVGPLDLDELRRARAKMGWTVKYESI
jgi:hypothetical protein